MAKKTTFKACDVVRNQFVDGHVQYNMTKTLGDHTQDMIDAYDLEAQGTCIDHRGQGGKERHHFEKPIVDFTAGVIYSGIGMKYDSNTVEYQQNYPYIHKALVTGKPAMAPKDKKTGKYPEWNGHFFMYASDVDRKTLETFKNECIKPGEGLGTKIHVYRVTKPGISASGISPSAMAMKAVKEGKIKGIDKFIDKSELSKFSKDGAPKMFDKMKGMFKEEVAANKDDSIARLSLMLYEVSEEYVKSK